MTKLCRRHRGGWRVVTGFIDGCGVEGTKTAYWVEGIQVHADEGGVTQTRGGIYWIILPAGYLGSSFWGMVFILASTNLLATRIAAGCFLLALVVVFFYAKNWLLRGLCIGFIIFVALVWFLQEATKVHILRYVILFIGVMNSLFSVYELTRAMLKNLLKSALALVMASGGVLFGFRFVGIHSDSPGWACLRINCGFRFSGASKFMELGPTSPNICVCVKPSNPMAEDYTISLDVWEVDNSKITIPLPSVDSVVKELLAEKIRLKSQVEKEVITLNTPFVFAASQRPQTNNQSKLNLKISHDKCAFCEQQDHWKAQCPLLLNKGKSQQPQQS
ncbi:hypothetical protein ZIOFF_018648 [Zingiber officinale]|uniref:Uncharacterized protein n=1 Tax=Zingiber officinale TaxID=94328 RepID=A0A8J5H6C0_ZINOF|nr:hypothetical protein ZIOFF_018648 [Zingiber officinale]